MIQGVQSSNDASVVDIYSKTTYNSYSYSYIYPVWAIRVKDLAQEPSQEP